MKKTLAFFIGLASLVSIAQENDTWRIGAQWGFQGNHADLIGGQTIADSRFEQHDAGGGALNIFARYDYNQHWMLNTGIGLSNYGFEFSLAQNYSLLNRNARRNVIKNDIGVLELPVMIHYKFNPNCKQVKWLVGLGFIQNLQTGYNQSGTYKEGNEATPNISYFKSDVVLIGSLFPTIRFSVGREKIFNSGRILNFSMLLNYGFKQSAQTVVTYNIDGKDYQHKFSNQGNFFGFRMAYYLMPIKENKVVK